MAEMLVFNRNNPGGDTQYKVGDVVVVKEDGWGWGRLEGPPTFRVVKVPGVTVEELEEAIQPEYHPGGETLKRIRTHKYEAGELIDKRNGARKRIL